MGQDRRASVIVPGCAIRDTAKANVRDCRVSLLAEDNSVPRYGDSRTSRIFFHGLALVDCAAAPTPYVTDHSVISTTRRHPRRSMLL